MKIINFLSLLFISISLSSCLYKNIEYTPLQKNVILGNPHESIEPLNYESVEFLYSKPRRSSFRNGTITVNGNRLAVTKDSVVEAKKKASLLGSDFILLEDSGFETVSQNKPGYSAYESRGSSYLSGSSNSIYGAASERALAYSVGPSVITINYPWWIYSTHVYLPCCVGVDFDKEGTVIGFRFKNSAEEAGMEIGDKVIGIDEIDVRDERLLSQHLMNISPGDKIIYHMIREGKRINFTLIALPND